MTPNAANIGPIAVGNYPYYLRLVRQGNIFTGYASATNGNWQLLGTRTITMSQTIEVGLATTSHRDGVLATAIYDNVSIIQSSTIAAKGADFFLSETAEAPSKVEDFNSPLTVYPNPTKSEVEILIGQQPSDLKEVYLYDMSRRLVQQYQAKEILQTNGVYKFNTIGLEEGVYIVNIKTNSSTTYNYQLVVKKQ